MALFRSRAIGVVVIALFVTASPAWGEQSRRWKKWWIASAVALAASTAVDFSSSVGKYETNPMLRNGSGQFSVNRGVAIKGGIAAGMIAYQAFMMRGRQPQQVEKAAAIANFATAGLMTGVAIRNRGIPRAPVE